MIVVVTGCAGFIGFHTCLELNKIKNIKIIGIDNMNKYYDINLKKNRIKILKKNKNFKFLKIDLKNFKLLKNKLNKVKIDYLIHLAAQAGVRYSLKNPKSYLDNNISAFFNILEISKIKKIKHLIYASTSSVYGDSKKFPLKENFNTDRPLTFYAASKKSNEIMAYSYSAIYKIPSTCLRFFTVYGPYGRPDMALFIFTKKILSNEKVELFNNGNHIRDWTYIDDVTSNIRKLINKKPNTEIPHRILNIASSNPITLKKFTKLIEINTNKKLRSKNIKFQIGDVLKTYGDTKALKKIIKSKSHTNIDIGIKNFVEWYKNYYNIT